MKKIARLIVGIGCLALFFSLTVCNGNDEEDTLQAVAQMTWDDLARLIDAQLGDISDGTANAELCGGNGLALGEGAHCKNRLKGTVTLRNVIQMVQMMFDGALFYGDLTDLGPESLLFKHGYHPQTQAPCIEDLDGVPGPDVFATCQNGNTHIACQDTGDFNFILDYNQCEWLEGATVWVMSGRISYISVATSSGEAMTLATPSQFTLTHQASGATMVINGAVLKYQIINPFTGMPMIGTTGTNIDGMIIINVKITIDNDGDGIADAPIYPLEFAADFEDGVVFITGSNVVWLETLGVLNNVTFFETGRPWNGLGVGCKLDIVNLDPVARTFDIQSETPYGLNACFDDMVGVSF